MCHQPSKFQIAELVLKKKEDVWNAMIKFAPQLNKLQQKDETICCETPLDQETIDALYWKKVGGNLVDLIGKIDSATQVYMYTV
jgi:hypothetical protein